MNLKQMYHRMMHARTVRHQLKEYGARFEKYAYVDCQCTDWEQFRASITRLYHTIEKGLAYIDFRPGFGKENIEQLLQSLHQYAEHGYDCTAEFYGAALSCLEAYISKNKAHGLDLKELEARIAQLPGASNGLGGVIEISAPVEPEKMNFKELMSSRHSIRHFSAQRVDSDALADAVRTAQYTPSACNRQGWKTRIIQDKNTVAGILANQNGNKGFGNEIDQLIIITADLRAQQRNREVFQAYIDGGMYAANILNALHYKGIGSVPLSAALTSEQERNVRQLLAMDDAEVLILIIGVGNYPPGSILTTRSERRFEPIQTC